MTYLRDEKLAHEIVLQIAPANASSLRVAEKGGYIRVEGLMARCVRPLKVRDKEPGSAAAACEPASARRSGRLQAAFFTCGRSALSHGCGG